MTIMNCTTVRTLIEDRVEGRLAQLDRRAFDAHVSSCEACAKELRTWRELFDGLDSLAHVEAPQRISRAVLAHLRAEGRIREARADRRRAIDRLFALPARVRYPLTALAVSVVLWAPVALVLSLARESLAPAFLAVARAAAALDRLVHETRVVSDVVETMAAYVRAAQTVGGALESALGADVLRAGALLAVTALLALSFGRRLVRAKSSDHVTIVV